MNLESAILSIIVGYIRGGRLSNLGRTPFRASYAFALPLILLTAAVVVSRVWQDSSVAVVGRNLINILQYVVLLTIVAFNIRLHGMKLITAGAFCNFIGLAANGGNMPISESAARAAGILETLQRTDFVRHVIIAHGARLGLLTDIIPVPIPKIHTVLSIGDVLLAIGIFVLIQKYMCMPSPGAQSEKAN